MSSRRREIGLAAGAIVLAAIIGCGAADEDPFVEYPEGAGVLVDAGGGSDAAVARDAGDAEASGPIAGKQVLAGSVFVLGVTSDGHLVFDDGKDVKVLPEGSAASTTVVSDYHSDTDSLLVRGRFVAAWLGDATGAKPLTLWGKTGGVQTVAALAFPSSFFPKNAADDFAYTAPASDLLHRDVWATKAGAAAGVRVIADLSTGLVDAPCRPTVTWSASALLVAGCPDGGTTPRVAVYALDGSGPTKIVLDGSAPGIWPNRARSHALVQTEAASSIRALAGAAAPVPLDGPVAQAVFSTDDTKVVYRAANGKVKRAFTTAPVSPVELLPAALALLAVSPDARFALVATTGDPADSNSDIVLADATTPGTGRTLAAQEGIFIGLSKSGTHALWLAERGLGFEGTLYVASLPNGTPQKLSPLAERVTLDGDVVYWQELDRPSKSNVLKAARFTTTAAVITVEQSLDPVTTQTVVIGKRLFVASKLGLWEYPALTP